MIGIVTCLFNLGIAQSVLENALKTFEQLDAISIYFNDGFIIAHVLPDRIGKMLPDVEIIYGDQISAAIEAVLAGRNFQTYSYSPALKMNVQLSLISFQIGNSDTTWSIMMCSDEKYIMKDVNAMTRFTVILAAIAIIATAAIVYFALSHTTKPIVRVAATLKDIAEGEGALNGAGCL